MAYSPKKKQWQDHYTRKAKSENYPARSVYKLEEIQKKHSVLKKGDRVLDLGCAPGSWLLFAAKCVGPKGRVTGIDLKPVTIRLPSNTLAITGDINDVYEKETIESDYSVILSDMAPATTGNKIVDSARSSQLCQIALSLTERHLLPGGNFVCKIFQGEDFKPFSETIKTAFNRQRIFKPKSSRKKSREIYIIGLGKK